MIFVYLFFKAKALLNDGFFFSFFKQPNYCLIFSKEHLIQNSGYTIGPRGKRVYALTQADFFFSLLHTRVGS